MQFEASLTNDHIVGEDFLSAFYKLFCLTFYVSNDQWKNTVWQRFLQGTWEIFLWKNNLNFNSYKLSYNPFLSFHRNQKQESNCQQVGGLVTRNSFAFYL